MIKFGKYKGEKTLSQVVKEHPDYVRWVMSRLPDQAYAQPLIKYAQMQQKAAQSVRSAQSTKPTKRPIAKAAQVPSRPTPETLPEGPNGDFYQLPKTLLKDFRVWACAGKTADPGKPFVYDMKGDWRFVGNVIARKTLAVNLKNPALTPDEYLKCEEFDASKLTDLQYARYVAALLEEEGRSDPGESRDVFYKGGRVQVTAKIRFRGVVLENGPYVAPSLDQKIYAPEEWNLGKQQKTAMASLVGLKVQPLGPSKRWFEGLIVCNESMKEETLTAPTKSSLVSMIKTPEVKSATEKAPLGELVLIVSRNCTSEDSLKMSFVSSALRPCLAGQEERLRKVQGFEDWRNIPPAKLTLRPSERQRIIQAQLTRLSQNLFGIQSVPKRMTEAKFFRKLKEPTLIYGSGSSMSGSEKPSRMLFDLKRRGAFEVMKGFPAGGIRLNGVIFGRASQDEVETAKEALRSMRRMLQSFGIPVAAEQVNLFFKPGSHPQEVREVMEDSDLTSQDALLVFQSSSMKPWDVTKFYERVKYECLRSSGLNGQHIASQWFDFKKENVWHPSSRSFGFALDVLAIGLLAKLGHAPWAVSAENWFTHSGADKPSVAVVGYDVCHLQDRKNSYKRHHVAAGIRVESNGEADPWTLSRVSFQTERIQSETVPPAGLRRLIPADFARGKLVIVHRDGEFPLQEIESLESYHAELQAEDEKTAFVLVECVKWAGGSPRLYDGRYSARAGTMFTFHDEEVLLASSKDIAQGTANPINIRLARVLGTLPESFALDDFAWAQSVYDLSFLHHGSVIRRPRLPITTHFADRLAYMLASVGDDGADWDRELEDVSGNQQFWL